MVFNEIGDFRWRKGRVAAAVTLIAGDGTRFTVAQLEVRELAAPVKKYPGGDSKVQSLQRATGFGSLASSLIQESHRDDVHARVGVTGERCRPSEDFVRPGLEEGDFRIAKGPSVQPSLGLMQRIFFGRLILVCGPSWS